MLDAYVRFSSNAFKWLLLVLLELFGPLLRWVFGFFAGGGLLGFLVALLGYSDKRPELVTFMYASVTASLLGTFLLVYYEILVTSMTFDRVLGDVDKPQAQESGLRRFLNGIGLVCIYAGVSFGAYVALHLKSGEAVFVGFAIFFGVGIFLGCLRWMYAQGASAFGLISNQVTQVAGQIKAALPQRKATDASEVAKRSVVVKFRPRIKG